MMVQGKEKADKQCSFVKESLKSVGLVVNEIFCWEPRQEVVWLRFKWCRHSIPEESCHYSH